MAPYLPKDLIELITWISPDPEAWFVGQFVKFLLQPKPWLKNQIKQLQKQHPGIYSTEITIFGFRVDHDISIFVWLVSRS